MCSIASQLVPIVTHHNHNSRSSTTSGSSESESTVDVVGPALTFLQIHVDAYMFTLSTVSCQQESMTYHRKILTYQYTCQPCG